MLINTVLTAPEAARLWHLSRQTVNQKCIDSEKKLTPNPFYPHEYRKAEGVWLVTAEGMKRIYGPLNSNERLTKGYNYD